MEAISGRKTLQEIAADHAIHPIQVSQWKKQLLESASDLFGKGRKDKERGDHQTREAELFQEIGKLKMELEWLKKSLSCSTAHELRRLVDQNHPQLSVRRQCELLGLPKSTLYYKPVPVRAETLRIMARIDAWYLDDPASGSRRMVDYLAAEGIKVGRDQVRNLMRRTGLRALYPKPRTTIAGDPSERFPCHVDLEKIHAPDDAWATDISYIPLRKGFLYLVAIVDLYSRHILSWKLSNSLDTDFCLLSLEMALGDGRKPRIIHSDQGVQFTSRDFVKRLREERIKISWSGRKRCYCFAEAYGDDNILVERLWRTVKYEEGYIRAYEDGWDAEVSLASILWRYCHARPHRSLGGKTPHMAYSQYATNPSRSELTIIC